MWENSTAVKILNTSRKKTVSSSGAYHGNLLASERVRGKKNEMSNGNCMAPMLKIFRTMMIMRGAIISFYRAIPYFIFWTTPT